MGSFASADTDGLPVGDLAFLFTDIEGSTPRWERNPSRMRRALALHDEVVNAVISGRGGMVFNHTGDGVTSVFTAIDVAIVAAIELQESLQAQSWPDGDRLKIRIGLHAGEAEPTGGQYFGIPLNRAARIMDAANGDQISASAEIAANSDRFDLRSNGIFQLRGVGSEELFQLRSPRIVADERPFRSAVTSTVIPLPAVRGELIGRDRDLSSVGAMLDESRLVTLVGPGGVGKTRLAIEAARRRAERYDLGPMYCELGAITEAGSVAEVVAQAVGARRQPDLDLVSSIAAFFGGRNALLVLDNCEHVLDETASVVDRLLEVDGLTVLATSRQPLGLWDHEQRWPVEPLDPAGSAADLFVTRARQRDPHFKPDAAARTVLADICGQLDGLPAAIELAAARIAVLSPDQLRGALEDLFVILRPTGGDRSRSLAETIGWSHNELDAEEGELFDRLSVFPSSFSLEAAAGLSNGSLGVGAALDHLQSLVDKSMIVPVRGGRGVRFRMLQTFRAYGREQLEARGEAAAARRAHAHWFVDLADHEAALLLTGKESEIWDHLTVEWDNLRAAFELLMDEDLDRAVDLVVDLAWFATFSMRFELFTWARRLLDDPRTDGHAREPALLGATAVGSYFFAEPDAVELASRSIELDPSEPTGLGRGALAAIYLNNLHANAEAGAITEAWLSTVNEDSTSGNRLWAMALRTFHLSLAVRPGSQDNRSRELAAETLALADATASASAMALGRWAVGLSRAADGDFDGAFESWHDGVDVAGSLGSQHLLTHLIRGLLAHWQTPTGDLATVLEANLDYLRLAIDQHYLTGTSHLLGVVAISLARAGDARTGAALLGAMEANGHLPRPPALPMVRAELGEDFAAASAQGTGWSIAEAGEIAVDTMQQALNRLFADEGW